MMSTPRRIATTTAAIVLLGVAAAVLVGSGIAIGAGGATATGRSDTAFEGELDALLAADQTTVPDATAARRVDAAVAGLRRLTAARHLVHGTVVVDLPRLGGLTTIQLDHGTVSAVSATSLSVAEAGNSTATVVLGGQTHVRRHAGKAAIGDLKIGDEVFVLSKVEADGPEAYLVVVPAI